MAVAGFAAEGKAEQLTHGVPTTGRIANGALVERVPKIGSERVRRLELELRNPDFNTAIRAADAINAYTRRRYKRNLATANNSRVIVLSKPARTSATRMMLPTPRRRQKTGRASRVLATFAGNATVER